MSAAFGYGASLLPEPYTILGLRLRPFSLGHYILLKSCECGFVGEEAKNKVGLADLILACAVCSHTYEEFIQLVQDGSLYTFLEQWGKEVEKQIKQDPAFDALSRFTLFSEYMRQSVEVLKYWKETEGEHRTGAHWSHSILNILISECGYSRTEALNLPFAQVLNDYLAFAERQGAIRIMEPWEAEQIEQQEETAR